MSLERNSGEIVGEFHNWSDIQFSQVFGIQRGDELRLVRKSYMRRVTQQIVVFPFLAVFGLFLMGCAGGAALREQRTSGARVSSISVESSGAISALEIRSLFPLNRGDAVDSLSFAAALDSLSQRIKRLPGQPYARIDSSRLETTPSGSFVLRIWIDSGPLALVDTLILQGVPEASEGLLRRGLLTKPGEPFDPKNWSRDLQYVLDQLQEMGHPFARVTYRPLEIEGRRDTVGVIAGMTLMPGRRVTLGRIELAGLENTDRNLLNPMLGSLEGELYSTTRLEQVRFRLQRSGLFTLVESAELFRDSRGQFGALYRVEEMPVGEASGAAGYAPAEEGGGLAGALDLRLLNLFGGGRSIAVSWQRDSESLASYRIAYGQPWLFETPLSVSSELTQEVYDSAWVARQARLELTYDSFQGWSLRGGVVGRSVLADSFATALDTLEYGMTGIEGAVQLDTRDNPLLPRQGGAYSAWAELHFVRGDGPDRVRRTGLDLTHHLPLGRQLGLMGSLHAVEAIGEGGALPRAEWPRIGGAATVRGYVERSLQGTRAGWTNLELRRFLGEGLMAFLLSDVAVLDGDGATRWVSSFGFGAQIASGRGSAVQIAFAVPEGAGLSAGVIHLVARTTF